MNFSKNVQNEVCVVWWRRTHQNEAKELKFRVAKENLRYRAPYRAPRAKTMPKENFQNFVAWLIRRNFWCAWCPHSNKKIMDRKIWRLAVILMGMPHSCDICFEFCGNLNFWIFLHFEALLKAWFITCAREKSRFWGSQRSEWVRNRV